MNSGRSGKRSGAIGRAPVGVEVDASGARTRRICNKSSPPTRVGPCCLSRRAIGEGTLTNFRRRISPHPRCGQWRAGAWSSVINSIACDAILDPDGVQGRGTAFALEVKKESCSQPRTLFFEMPRRMELASMLQRFPASSSQSLGRNPMDNLHAYRF